MTGDLAEICDLKEKTSNIPSGSVQGGAGHTYEFLHIFVLIIHKRKEACLSMGRGGHLPTDGTFAGRGTAEATSTSPALGGVRETRLREEGHHETAHF